MVTMRRLLALTLSMIMFSISLCANEHYLLPEHKSDLLHSLKRKIERSHEFTIITRHLESPQLSKSIEKALKKSGRFHLITTDLRSAAYYAKYKNTTVDVPSSEQLVDSFRLNILIIDRSDVCFSTLAFSEAVLKNSVGNVFCSTNAEDIAFAKELEERFTHRFEAYNQ